jgi:hypothetical protein
MKPKPIKHYPEPRYPARLLVVSNPRLLEKYQPPAWRARGMAGAAAVLIAAGLAAAAEKGKAPAKATVAPVFAHGEGRGAVGGVQVGGLVFMSEDEALGVINEELGKAGLNFTRKDVEWKDVVIPGHEQHYADGKESVAEVPGKPLNVDREDPDRHVAVEFVSQRDYFDLGGARSASTMQSYNLPEAAKTVADQVKAKGPAVYFGVFYDPLTLINPSEPPNRSGACSGKIGLSDQERAQCQEQSLKAHAEARDRAAAQSKDQLRAQVKDFINWLKAQGAI